MPCPTGKQPNAALAQVVCTIKVFRDGTATCNNIRSITNHDVQHGVPYNSVIVQLTVPDNGPIRRQQQQQRNGGRGPARTAGGADGMQQNEYGILVVRGGEYGQVSYVFDGMAAMFGPLLPDMTPRCLRRMLLAPEPLPHTPADPAAAAAATASTSGGSDAAGVGVQADNNGGDRAVGAAQGADPLEDCDGHLSCPPEDLRALLHAAGEVAGHGEGQGQGQGEAGSCPRSWPQVPLQQLRLRAPDGSCLPAWHVGQQLLQQLQEQQQEDEEDAGGEGLDGEARGVRVGLARRRCKGRRRATGKGGTRDARMRGVRRRGTRGVGVGMGQEEGLVAALDGDAERGSRCLGAVGGDGDGQGVCAWAGRDAGSDDPSLEEQQDLGVQQQEVQQGWATEAGGPQEEDGDEDGDAVEGEVLEEGEEVEEGSAAADGEVDGAEEWTEQQEEDSSGLQEAGVAGAGGAARGRRRRRRERPPSDEAPEWALEAATEGACRGMPTAAAKLVGHDGPATRLKAATGLSCRKRN